VVIVKIGWIVMGKALETVCAGLELSVTAIVGLKLPDTVGVPLRAPVPLASVSPVGSVPDNTDHERGGVPLMEVNVCEYAVPATPLGRLVVVIVRMSVTVIWNVRLACCWGVKLSPTCAANCKVPMLAGVPLRTPALERLRPGGS